MSGVRVVSYVRDIDRSDKQWHVVVPDGREGDAVWNEDVRRGTSHYGMYGDEHGAPNVVAPS